jgi:hypothetical protein
MPPRIKHLLTSSPQPARDRSEPGDRSANRQNQPQLPQYLVELLDTLPVRVDRRTGAKLVTQHIFPVSHRTLEKWPLPVQHVNGYAVIATRALFEAAYARLSAAPVIMSGRSTQGSTAEIDR